MSSAAGVPPNSWLAADVSTPALVLDREVLERNLTEMRDLTRSSRMELFPHAKTHRMLDFGLLQVETGADGLCVAKLGEAEAFGNAGVDRIFVAYPVVGRDKAVRALRLASKVELTLGTDSVLGATSVGEVFAEAGRIASLMLAIDSGLGREGVSPANAPDLAERIAGIDGIELTGIYTHEGSVYEAANRDDLEELASAAANLMVRTAERIRARGVALRTVSLGSSASAKTAAQVAGVTQLRPGIYATNDLGQVALGNATLETTAIRVIATVISHHDDGRVCIDAGSKALSGDLLPAAAHRADYPGFGLIANAPRWTIDRLSEEHGWLRWLGVGPPQGLPVGSRVEIVPNHACMPFGLLRRATVLSVGGAVELWEGLGPGASE